MIAASFFRNRYGAQADPARTERRIELVVVVLALLLILQITYSFSRLATVSPPETIAPAPDSLTVASVLRHQEVNPELRQEIRMRPLFWTSRRPLDAIAAAEPVEEDVEESEIKDVKLVGLFGSGELAGIIILVKGQQQRVGLGEEVAGWRLDSVEDNTAVFTSGSRRNSLALMPEAGAPAPFKKSGRGRRR